MISFAYHCDCYAYAHYTLSILIQGEYCGSRPHFAFKLPYTIFITFPVILLYVSVSLPWKISFTLSYLTSVDACPFIIQILIGLVLMVNIDIRLDIGLKYLMYGSNVL